MKLWQTKKSVPLDPVVEQFTIGTDRIFDRFLVEFDAIASAAHAAMLAKQQLITKTEFHKLQKILQEIAQQSAAGKFSLKNFEDGHSAIEAELIKKLGTLGGKIHLGRSRNDQSATAIRLFAKSKLLATRRQLLGTISELLHLAEKFEKVPMPGFTHTRPAMLTTVGHFFAAFAEALTDDLQILKSVTETFDACPLGAAAGFGTTIPVDRKLVAKLLGFKKVENNTLRTQLARGGMELAVLSALGNATITSSRLANDLIYFSAPEFKFFDLKDNISTGSSIMPQKRNPDPLEISRGTAGVILGQYVKVAGIVKGLSAGYQRELQLTKQPLIEGLMLTENSFESLSIVLRNLIVNKKQLAKAAKNPQIYATEFANNLVIKKGLSFREAYRESKKIFADAVELPQFDPTKTLAQTCGIGMPGNLNLGLTRKFVTTEKRTITNMQQKFVNTLAKIWQL